MSLALLGLPFDANSSYLRGPALAPPIIRAALRSDSSNLWTENGTDLGTEGLIVDAGDLPISISPTEDAFALITERTRTLVDQGFRLLALGGDHSVTYPAVRGVAKHHSKLNILHFDAHPDLYDIFEGKRYSHACPFARIMEDGLAERLVQVGIRTMNAHQRAQAERFGVEVIEMRNLHRASSLRFDGPLYISFDMDALDPAFAPGVSHHEPGGLSTREAIAMIQGVRAPQIVAADIVELNPTRDSHGATPSGGRAQADGAAPGITAMAAAKLLKEIAARMVE